VVHTGYDTGIALDADVEIRKLDGFVNRFVFAECGKFSALVCNAPSPLLVSVRSLARFRSNQAASLVLSALFHSRSIWSSALLSSAGCAKVVMANAASRSGEKARKIRLIGLLFVFIEIAGQATALSNLGDILLHFLWAPVIRVAKHVS
jgi:hypothetical protein